MSSERAVREGTCVFPSIALGMGLLWRICRWALTVGRGVLGVCWGTGSSPHRPLHQTGAQVLWQNEVSPDVPYVVSLPTRAMSSRVAGFTRMFTLAGVACVAV